MTPEELAAREAIRHTIACYNRAGDSDDAEGFAGCFTEDALFVTRTVRLEGREAIRQWKAAGTAFSHGTGGASATFRVHHVTNIYIELLSADRALTRSPWMVITDVGLDHSGIYHDIFRHEGDRWLIEKRMIDTLWRAETSFISADAVGGVTDLR